MPFRISPGPEASSFRLNARCRFGPRLPILVGLALLLALPPSAHAGLAREALGTGVWISLPEGYRISSQYTGFENPDLGSKVKVTLLDKPFEQVTQELSRDMIGGEGAVVLEEKRLRVSGHDARLSSTVQMAAGEELNKWLLVFGSASRSVVVMASYPQSRTAEIGEPLRKALVELSWDPNAKVDPLGGLSFRVGETSGLKLAERLPSGGVLLAPEGETQGRLPEDPLFAVFQSSGDRVKLEASGLESFSMDRAQGSPAFSSVAEIVGGGTTIADVPAYELVADTQLAQGDVAVSLYQVVVLGKTKVLIVQGLVGRERADEFVPQFRELANSLSFVEVDAQ